MKKLIVIGIILLICGVAVFLGFFGAANWDINKLAAPNDLTQKTYTVPDVTESYNEINVENYDFNVKIIRGGDKISATYYENGTIKYQTTSGNGVFSIKEEKNDYFNKFTLLYLNFINLFSKTIVINIPQSYQGKLTINNVAGNLTVSGGNYTDLNIKNTSGTISVSDITAENAEVKNINGNIEINGLNAEKANINTINGRIDISSAVTDSLTAKNSTGNIDLTKCVCSDAKISTVSGNISYLDGVADKITGSATTGNIRIALIGICEYYTLKAQNAARIFYNQAGTDPEKAIILNTVSGNISVDFSKA